MLDELIDSAYKTFAIYPAPEEPVCSCPLCRLEGSHSRLKAMSVRDIPDELLWQYHFVAHAGNTLASEVKHFLPRYLEIVSRFQFGHFWAEIALERLALARGQWTEEEQTLLESWALAYFSHCLSQYHDRDLSPDAPHVENIVDIIIMLAHGGFDIRPLLDLWAGDGRLTALLHFKDFLLYGFNKDRSALENSFASDDWDLFSALSAWTQQSNVAAHFISLSERAVAENEPLLNAYHGGRTHLEEIATTCQQLREWHKQPFSAAA